MKMMHKFILSAILLLLLVACFAVPGAISGACFERMYKQCDAECRHAVLEE